MISQTHITLIEADEDITILKYFITLWRDIMKKLILTLMTFTFIALAGCGSEPPVEEAPAAEPPELFKISYSEVPAHNTNLGKYNKILEIVSLVDGVTITEVTANRGHCEVSQSYGHWMFPRTLKFGGTVTRNIQCTNIMEIAIFTDMGDYSYSFQ